MANRTENIALEIGSEVAEDMDMYVIDVTYKSSGGKNILCFYIDKENGIGIDECEKFSRAVELKLDECDPIKSEYSLEVSSPGADRQLKKEREFRYYIGKEVDVKLYKAIDGIKEFTGTLAGYDNDEVMINYSNHDIKIPVKETAYVKLHFEF